MRNPSLAERPTIGAVEIDVDALIRARRAGRKEYEAQVRHYQEVGFTTAAIARAMIDSPKIIGPVVSRRKRRT
jgi:hypothetical protein